MCSLWSSCRLEGDLSQRGVCRNNMCQTHSQSGKPGHPRTGLQKDLMLLCLPSLAAHWAPPGMFNWTSPGLGCTPEFLSLNVGPGTGNYCFSTPQGGNHSNKNMAAEQEMLRCCRHKGEVRRRERRRDLEKLVLPSLLRRGEGQWGRCQDSRRRGPVGTGVRG